MLMDEQVALYKKHRKRFSQTKYINSKCETIYNGSTRQERRQANSRFEKRIEWSISSDIVYVGNF